MCVMRTVALVAPKAASVARLEKACGQDASKAQQCQCLFHARDVEAETATVASSNYMHPDGLLPLLKDDRRILCEK